MDGRTMGLNTDRDIPVDRSNGMWFELVLCHESTKAFWVIFFQFQGAEIKLGYALAQGLATEDSPTPFFCIRKENQKTN